MFKFKFILVCYLVCICSYNALGSSGAEAKGAEGVKEKEFSGRQNEKWIEVQNELVKLKTKVDAQSVIVENLLKSKKHNSGKVSREEIEELKKEYEKLKELTEEHNKVLVDFQFRFPEKGLETGRKYIRIENQSMEQMENNTTFEGRLKRLYLKIKKQFQFDDDPNDNATKKPTHMPQKLPIGSKGLDSIKSEDREVTDQINITK
jgi:hypothetical protein